MTTVRPLRRGDLRQLLRIERRAFPLDPWTVATANGWLVRGTRGGRAWHATLLAWLIRFSRVNEAITLLRLVRLVTRGHPAGLAYIVTESGGPITGYACLQVADGRGDIQMLAVRPGAEGRGTGTRLVAELVAMAQARGCREVFLYVRADNTRARQLYQRAGFTDSKVLPRFYQPSGTDAVVMSLPLTQLSAAGAPDINGSR
ncbi:MAG TPA: GNAT family N-acetyltransferase [Streptosporangiaceae bacterium]|jgi:ribosomal-protein-alanine acetyltransferase